MTIRLNDHRPDALDAVHSIEETAAALCRQGRSAEAVAELMLYTAYRLHAKAQGAHKQVDGWQERTHASFQQAVAGFCVETCNATITEAGDVLLPHLRSGSA
jgi:hypothetical protein